MSDTVKSLIDKYGYYVLMAICLAAIISIIAMAVKHKKSYTNIHKNNIFNALAPSMLLWLFVFIIYTTIYVHFHKILDDPNIKRTSATIIILSFGFSFYRMTIFIEYFLKKLNKTKIMFNIEETALQFCVIIGKLIVIIVITLTLLELYKINISALVTGLGIGGIAVALAAQDTLSNLLGYLIIVLDKPFLVGNRIKIIKYDGNIERVGLRATHLRTLEGNMVIIPNRTIANSEIENVTGRETIRQIQDIILEPTLTVQGINDFMDSVKDILKNEDEVINDYQIFFDRYDAVCIVFKLWYWVDNLDYWDFMRIKERVNIKINTYLEEHNIKYAVSTNAMYIKNIDN